MATGRKAREEAFLDDPSLYPEFTLLIKYWRFPHALKRGFHQQRTAALLSLVALSAAASGAKMPAFYGGDDGGSADWAAYLARALNIDLLSRHFIGIGSALLCMLALTIGCLLVYPLHAWASSAGGTTVDRNGSISPSRSSPFSKIANAVAVAIPTTSIWAIAVLGAMNFDWGIASGLCVGLHSAGLTLKLISYVQRCCGGHTNGNASGSNGAPSVAHAASENSADTSQSSPKPNAKDEALPSIPERTCESKQVASVASTVQTDAAASVGRLTFGEVAFFLLLTPCLVCEPQLLKREARLPSKPARAMSEFFHAALTYLAVHATCSALFAPTLRVLATALHTSWTDADTWEALRAQGSGDWLHSVDAGVSAAAARAAAMVGEGDREGGVYDGSVITFVLAAFFGNCVLPPTISFLMFYAFWHCVCVGCAELWGYPDRNIYGPWWLVMDDLSEYFRLWSAPVSRWLSATIHRPMIAAGRRRQLARREKNARVNGNGGNSSKGSSSSGGGGGFRRWWISSLALSFLASGALHELVGFVAMRGTFWPVSTISLIVSGSMIPVWDTLFPVLVADAAATSTTEVGGVDGAASAGTAKIPLRGPDGATKEAFTGRRRQRRPSIGAWRGWSPVVFYVTSSAPALLAVHYVVWQWWRHTHMLE